VVDNQGLRHRTEGMAGVAMGTAFATPFADEMHAEFHHDEPKTTTTPPNMVQSRESTATLLGAIASPAAVPQVQQQRPLIDTEETSNHPSEQLLDVTPTTSSSSHVEASDLSSELCQRTQEHSPSNYWSVNEWAENTSPSFYSPPVRTPHNEETSSTQQAFDTAASDASSGEDVWRFSQIGSEGDMGVLSEVGDGISTPGSWTEVGSSVSGGD